MRGEHVKLIRLKCCKKGSSPHARGAQRRVGLDALCVGIIPACAGSTATRASRSSRSRDHPRMRGEHQTFTEKSTFNQGSSPHARGARPCAAFVSWRIGIIPACAGSTRRRRDGRGRVGDHPRMRGEHKVKALAQNRRPGSSPHARGAPHGVERVVDRPGIIPACAGST